MGFYLTLLYIAFTFLSVADTLPFLAPYRLQLMLGILAMLASIPAALTSLRFILQLPFFLMIAFTGILVFSSWPHGWFGGAVVYIQKFMPAAILFFLASINLRSVKRLRVLRYVLLGVTFYILLNGIYEYHVYSEESPYVMYNIIDIFGTRIPRLRGLGVLGDPNQLGQFLLSIIPLIFVTVNPRGFSQRWVFVVPICALLLYGIYLTRSRGAVLGLAALVLLLLRERLKLVKAGIASGLVLAVLIGLNFAGGRAISVGGGADRLALWSDGLGMFQRSPLWGGGLGSYPDNFRLTVHNSFLLAACELGLFGYFFWVGLLITIIWQLQVVIADQTFNTGAELELRRWGHAVALSLYLFLVTSFFLSQTYDPLLYLLLGVGFAIISTSAERRRVTSLMPPNRNWVVWAAGLCLGSLVLIYMMVRVRAI